MGITWANVPNTDPAIGSDEAGTSALINLYDTLVYPTSSGALQPDLATSWTVSPNGTTYTFNLRSGVTFHNGDALTASDVVFSMNRLLTMGQGYSYLFTASVANTTAIGTTTVVFDLKKTFGPFLSTLPRLYILDQKQVVAHEVSTGSQYGSNLDYGSAWLLTHDAGSGPYSITYANLETNVILKEFPNYWNGTLPNQPQEVNFIGSTTPSTVASLFKSGQIQITDTYQTYQNVETLAALPNAKLVTIPSLNEFYFMIDTQKQPTNDIYLREAMTYAFNYSAVINNIWPGVQYAAGPVPAALPGHNPNIPASHQDLAMANQLIKQSAYYKSGNLSSYPITFYWVTQVPQEQSLAEQFASDMAKIGITVNVVGEPWLTVVADLGNETSSPNIAAVQDAASYYEAGSLLQSRYTTPAEGTWEQNEWLHNSTLDSLIYSALSTVNQTQRFQDYFNIQQQIYNMYPSIYAFDVTEVRAYYPSVVNWYAANGHPNTLEGYDWFFRDIQFYPAQLAALFG
ncbi:MAG TPA: ABC transporter substrate-binding protein [Terriglobales bacterium]|nr:ABC transporter substrate-binding protein [Terriglobales bacterium]